MYEHQNMTDRLRGKYSQATHAEARKPEVRILKGGDYRIYQCLQLAMNTASVEFFLKVSLMLAKMESATYRCEQDLRVIESQLNIQTQLQSTGHLQELDRVSQNAQAALVQYSPDMQDLGLNDALQHFENMKNFILLVNAHLQEAETKDLDQKHDLKAFKTKEFKDLCAFIETTFDEQMRVEPPKAVVDVTEQRGMRP